VSARPLLTTRQVAELLAVSPATVLRRWRAGEIPGYRLGSNVLRFDADEVQAWLEARREGPSGGGEVSPTPSAHPARVLVIRNEVDVC
jgi:excisionase family DNA binding protein